MPDLIEASSPTDRDLDALAMPVPSPETLDFLGQSIAAAAAEHQSAALAGLDRIGRRYVPQASELALAYALRAAEHGHPRQSLVGVRLAGARVSGWAIGTKGHDDTRLPMAGADLSGADLRHATFHQVDLIRADLSGADLTVAELHNSCLTSARFVGARAIGTVIRECELGGAEIARAATYRTQILRCIPAPEPAPGLLIATLPDGDRQAASGVPPLRPLTGHTDWVRAVAWSPTAPACSPAATAPFGSGTPPADCPSASRSSPCRGTRSRSSAPSRTSSSRPARGPGAGSAGTSSKTVGSRALRRSPSEPFHPCIPPPNRRSRPEVPPVASARLEYAFVT